LAGKINKSYSEIDKSVYFFAQKCGKCHPGGGGLEYDRDGYSYYDEQTGKFGYEKSGRKPELDGDYTAFAAGDTKFGAPWNKSGVLEADCLMCHLKGYNWKVRSAALNGRKFRWAPAIGAGWADVEMGKDKKGGTVVKSVAINYGRKDIVDLKSLGDKIVKEVPAENCWSCHNVSDTKKRGRSIDPDRDIHLRKGVTCVTCHPSDPQHNFAKGDAALSTVRDDLDYTMKGCRDCHLDRENKKAPYPAKHSFPPLHYALLSCESCHISYKEVPSVLMVDNATTGKTIGFPTSAFLKYDRDKPRRWMPVLKIHRGKIKPYKELVSMWWGNLDEKTGVVAPIPLWKIRMMKKPKINDDNGDEKPEVNTHEEIKAFLEALKQAKDKFGNPIAENPALVKGGRIYKLAGVRLTHYEDHQAETHGFSISHNVLPASQAIGANGCSDCHSQGSAFFDRKVLVDPYDESGKPVFEPTWKRMGYTAEQVEGLTKPEVSSRK
jgi:hypothetical protein